VQSIRSRNLVSFDRAVETLTDNPIISWIERIDSIVAGRQCHVAGDNSSRYCVFGEYVAAENSLRLTTDGICNQATEDRTGACSRSIQRARTGDVIFRQSPLGEGRQTKQTIHGLSRLHCRAQNRRMLESQKMSDFVRKGRFEIVSSRRAVTGEAHVRIQSDVGFRDRSARIIEDARASRILVRAKRGCVVAGYSDQINPVAVVGRTNRLHGRSRLKELNVGDCGPMLQRAMRGADNVASFLYV